MRMLRNALLATVLTGLMNVGQLGAATTTINWPLISQNICNAIKSDNDGLRQSAMQRIIQYEGLLDVSDMVFDLVSIFRDHDDVRMRQLALIALYKTHDSWAMGFLKRRLAFEDSPKFRYLITAILIDTGELPKPASIRTDG
ncbi:MAG: hypothetical protein GXO82_07090 [Chlorobi bacterium]|nr:hypothetical protein [Chlorobiota bacterium]